MPDAARETRPVALVTGGAAGLGLEVARQLADAGHVVLVSGRDPAKAERAVADLGGAAMSAAGGGGAGTIRALPVPLDVSDDASVQAAAAALADDPGRLDVLVNNAAAYVDWSETATTADLGAARAVLETNLFGAWRTTQALLPLLRASEHPRVVNVSSGAGSHGDERFGLTARGGAAATYGISKAALNALTATIATELAATPVVVNAVCPDLTATYPGAEQMGARPVSESAKGVVWAATLPDDGPRGGFFRDGQPLAW